jgi:hypothetical protein
VLAKLFINLQDLVLLLLELLVTLKFLYLGEAVLAEEIEVEVVLE